MVLVEDVAEDDDDNDDDDDEDVRRPDLDAFLVNPFAPAEDVTDDDDDCDRRGGGGDGLGLDTFLVNPSAPAPSPASTLSYQGAPFYPEGSTAGRAKHRRWADAAAAAASDCEQPSSYLEAVRRPPRPVAAPQPSAGSVPGRGGAATGQPGS